MRLTIAPSLAAVLFALASCGSDGTLTESVADAGQRGADGEATITDAARENPPGLVRTGNIWCDGPRSVAALDDNP